MVRLISRAWLPAALACSAVTALLALLAFYQSYQQVVENGKRIDYLEGQVRGLGGDPDAPVVVNVRVPESPQPASPTMREPRVVVVQPTREPQPQPQPTRRAPSPSASTPAPTPTCARVTAGSTAIGGCL